MSVRIRLSERWTSCPGPLKDFFRHLGCAPKSLGSHFEVEFGSGSTCKFGLLEFLPGSELLAQDAWKVDFHLDGELTFLLINEVAVAAEMSSERSLNRVRARSDCASEKLAALVSRVPRTVRHLDLFFEEPLNDLNPISRLDQLRSLSLANCEGIRCLAPLSALEGLESLDISGLRRLEDISALSSLGGLRRIIANGCDQIESIESLRGLVELELLDLRACWELGCIDALAGLHKLTTLNLFQCHKVVDFSPIRGLSALRTLHACECAVSALDVLSGMGGLRELRLSLSGMHGSPDSPSNLAFVADLGGLEVLEVENWRNLTDLQPVNDLANLEVLNLGGCCSLESLESLAGMARLQVLGLSGCTRLRDLGAVQKLPMLRSISSFGMEGNANFSGCGSLRCLDGLSGLEWITEVQIDGCTGLRDLSVLGTLPNLESLSLQGCSGVSDLNPLRHAQKLMKVNIRGANRIRSVDAVRGIPALVELDSDFHPAMVCELLAHSACLRRDIALIAAKGEIWMREAQLCEESNDGLLESLVSTLCAAFSLLGVHQLGDQLQIVLDRHPAFSAEPWKNWFGGTLRVHGFGLYQQRIERIPVEVMSVGAIGGACVTLPLGEGSEWSCSWLARLEEGRLCGAAELLPVSVEICLACARLGQADALSRWLERFTDPSDPSALDPVQAALARFQMRRGEFAAAEVHILLIQSPQLRDPLLLEFIDAAGSSDPCKASILLLLLEDPAARAEAAKQMVLRDEVSGNQALLHRLIVALDGSPTALAELVSNLPQQSSGGLMQKISECLQADRKNLYAKIALDLEAKAAAFRSKI